MVGYYLSPRDRFLRSPALKGEIATSTFMLARSCIVWDRDFASRGPNTETMTRFVLSSAVRTKATFVQYFHSRALQYTPLLSTISQEERHERTIMYLRLWTDRARAQVRSGIKRVTSDIRLTESEAQWLQEACPYFTPAYITYLSKYRFKPEQVRITFTPTSTEGLQGAIDIDITGPWVETILWEVPLMACLSETYFQMVDTDWNLEGQAELAYSKAKSLIEAGCVFSDFGTRRRRSFEIHDLVVQNLVRAANELQGPHPGRLTGSSNVAALKGYADANSVALDLWEEVYPEALQIALTDTFSTQAFFKSFGANPERANKWTGLRQDSGDPFAFAPVAKEVYNQLGIDTSQKVIVYSDSLNVERCIQLQKQCADIGFKRESAAV
ncbi:nicotinate phosphoribosyltransferase [Salix suchowensis]|nr:nicotinate phosphoribosyltransferase [Salix suchowensis]